MYRWLIALLLCISAGCYDGSFDSEGPLSTPPTPTTTLAELNRLVGSSSTTIDRNWVVSGRVTTSDRSGNFYQSIIIEEDRAALEISVALDALHNDFPIGSLVVVKLEGLAVGRRYGIVQAGLPPISEGYYPTDPIHSKAKLDEHLFRSNEPLVTPLATRYRIDQLTPALAGTLICIEGLTPTIEESTDPYPTAPTWEGYRTFADEIGCTIESYVSSYADFASLPLPEGRCTLTAILQYDSKGEQYILKLRDEKDCKE